MNVIQRLYNDFLRPSKEAEYEAIIKTAKNNGYEFHTILSFEGVIKNGLDQSKKYLILRRDVDTADKSILNKFLEIENKYGARATYYFRWSTLDVSLAKRIEASGGEASYHYEEIATFCYKHYIRSKDKVMSNIDRIRSVFILNLNRFRMETGLACLTVASHGDYANTKLSMPNLVLVDKSVRDQTGIVREAYDPEHMNLITCRFADQNEDRKFMAKAIDAILRNEPVIELLTHPRQWNSPFFINLKEEIVRCLKGLYLRL